MSVTTQGGSGRQSVTGSWRLCSCAGRQVTGFRRHISGFGRQWKGVTYKYAAENDNILLFACLDHYYNLSVCQIGIRKTSVLDICSSVNCITMARCPSLSCPLDSLGKLSRDILPPTLVILTPGGQAVQAGLSCPPPNTSKNIYMLFCYFSVSF